MITNAAIERLTGNGWVEAAHLKHMRSGEVTALPAQGVIAALGFLADLGPLESWGLRLMDMSCVDECPVDCIYEGCRKLYINPGECIDCGACEPVCPQDAIYLDKRVPIDQVEFAADNARFFSDVLPGRSEPLGSPRGARKVGPIGSDTPLVAADATK
jgi:NAD-dependent dihydropyrimidine dehydrogenase PreA subunit